MAAPRLVVIGASAGGIEVLRTVLADLPATFPAAVAAVVHVSSGSGGVLADILDRVGHLPVRHPHDGEPLEAGTVYLAPPGHHLVVREASLGVVRGPKENGHRPAVDPLFRSAARWHGPAVVGVVVSGGLFDGTAGLAAVRAAGGLAVVQDPADALQDSMPRSALQEVGADHVTTAAQLGALLVDLVSQPVGPGREPTAELVAEVEQVELELGYMHDAEHPGTPVAYSCPDCHGTLFELDDGDVLRFRCRVGHAWVGDALALARGDELDEALWTAIRVLEEQVSLTRRLARRAEGRGSHAVAQRFEAQAEEADARAATIRRSLLREGIPPDDAVTRVEDLRARG